MKAFPTRAEGHLGSTALERLAELSYPLTEGLRGRGVTEGKVYIAGRA